MLIFKYCKDGKAYSDFTVLEKMTKIIRDHEGHKNGVISFNTENVVNAVRIAIIRNGFDFTNVAFAMADVLTKDIELITLDEKINLSHWPKGFCDNEQNFLREIVSNRRKKD